MSFLYPRLISIARPGVDDSVGEQGYSGLSPDNETPVAAGIPAHIQADRQGTAPAARLPSDAAGQSTWKIIFKAANGLARNRDVITDDQGLRYQVIAAYWGPLVTTCRCEILEN